MTRNKIQQNAVELASQHKNLILEWCTGLGKSRAAILIQEKLQSTRTLIVVAEVAHIKNWEEEYIKHDKAYLLETTRIICYASLKKNVNLEIDLLILDEAHHSSITRLEYLKTIEYKNLLGLSATVGINKLVEIGQIFGNLHTNSISIKQAIKWGIIKKPKIIVLPLALNHQINNCFITQVRGDIAKRVTIKCAYAERWKYLKDKTNYPDLELILHCTELEKLVYYNEQMQFYKNKYFQSRAEYLKTKWLQIGSERKRFLGDLKTDVIKDFLKTLKKERYICFCSSIEQADKLGTNLTTIHSKKSKNSEVIDSFNNKEIDKLFTVGMLQEGQNLTDIDSGILIQLDGASRPFIQKSGRVYRGKEPTLYVFYYKETQDEVYLNNILEGIDNEYVQYWEKYL